MFKSFTVTLVALLVFFLGKDMLEGTTSQFIIIPVGVITVAALMVALIGGVMVALRVDGN
jgi:hypothetical protein